MNYCCFSVLHNFSLILVTNYLPDSIIYSDFRRKKTFNSQVVLFTEISNYKIYFEFTKRLYNCYH
jgi:hypothetical protein